jgi:hypothetical protein
MACGHSLRELLPFSLHPSVPYIDWRGNVEVSERENGSFFGDKPDDVSFSVIAVIFSSSKTERNFISVVDNVIFSLHRLYMAYIFLRCLVMCSLYYVVFSPTLLPSPCVFTREEKLFIVAITELFHYTSDRRYHCNKVSTI